MSQRDLVAELRAARTEAPADVREHVRLIAADAAPPRRTFTWRRALVLAVPVAAAVAAAIVFTRPTHHQAAPPAPVERAAAHGSAKVFTPAGVKAKVGAPTTTLSVAPTPGRVVRYGASLTLRVPTRKAVSNDVKQALRITQSLGGYATSVNASTQSTGGVADLVLKIPRAHVQQAITRLSALGTITGEQVYLQDLEAGLNSTDRTIARLQKQLATLRAETQTTTVTHQIAQLTNRIASLQRGEAATRRSAHYATVDLHLATPTVAPKHKPGHGPLHGLGIAFRWIGIGAIYSLALGGPLAIIVALIWLAARTIRRRRVDALLAER